MPYSIRKLPNKDLYRVYNTKTKEVHSYATTLENAKKQVKLLHMIDAGVPITKGSVASKKQGSSIKQPILLEMFKGTGSVGKQAKKMGFQVTSLDFDPIYTPDIETDVLDWDYKKYSTENNYVPDMIWSSPPCNTFSPMVYRLKERDTQTAKPFSDRAKLGTKILHKTLEIIEYFRSKNPKLLFIIENPRGMMRMDAKMKKIARETTLYCIYGDFKKKPTDFWSNFPNGLQLDQETKQCPGKVIPVQNLKTIEERYSMPSKLIKHFLEEFKKQYSHPLEKGDPKERMKRVEVSVGGSIETDKFENEGIVSLPEFRSVKLKLPTYMYKKLPNIKGKPPTYKYRLVIPITSSRNLSSRKNETSLNITQKPVSRPIIDITESQDEPKLEDFSPADRLKLQQYYYNVKQNENKNPDTIDNDNYEIKERGRPLPCQNARPKQPKQPKSPKQSIQPIVDFIPPPSAKVASSKASSVSSKASSVSSKASSKSSSKSLSSIGSLSSLGSLNFDIDDYDPDKLSNKSGKGIKNNILSNNKMANSWITYVKEFASKNGMSYRDALRDPKCKEGYKKGGAVCKRGKGVVDEMGDQDLIAEVYNDSELGANGGKKYISL